MSAEGYPSANGGHRPTLQSPAERAHYVRDAIPAGGLFAGMTWRISPSAFPIPSTLLAQLEALGPPLLAFYRACNVMYRHSVQGKLPRWIADYLDAGKPRELVELSRCDRFENSVPRVIRPDVILGNDRFFITELDSVPGGIGLTGWLGKTYGELGDDVVGGQFGMMEGFAAAMETENKSFTVVVSEEAATYRPEMEWLGQQIGFAVLKPEEMAGTLGGQRDLKDGPTPDPSQEGNRRLGLPSSGGAGGGFTGAMKTTIYRFFELFDLANVPNAQALLDAAARGDVAVTPPVKPQLEEKMLFAFLWTEQLQPFWCEQLGEKVLDQLKQVFPYTWIVDPTPLAPQAVIPGLGIRDWREMARFSQKKRELVLKISGFHEQAWGSRGVYVGHDLSSGKWAEAIERALASFPQHPFILQRFEKSRLVDAQYFDFEANTVRTFKGRVRLCPYYFVVNDTTKLGGILATICPADKKLLHGMSDAVLSPCCLLPP
jgi:hypothetical protein